MLKIEKSLRLRIIDDILSQGRPVSFREIAAELNKNTDKPIDEGSFSSQYGDNFRQDMKLIRDTIAANANVVRKDMLKTDGCNKQKRYWYAEPGFSILPYLIRNFTVANTKALDMAIDDLKNTLPDDVFDNMEFTLKSRFEYSFRNGEKGIDYGENLALKGRQWLPLIYKSLNKIVLKIRYKPYTFTNPFSFNLHPYLLKQYNNRWFLFGKKENIGNNSPEKQLSISDYYWNVPIDRIENIVEQKNIELDPRPDNYLEHFNDIIGVTYKVYGTVSDVIEPYTILIGVHDKKTWGNVTTKPLHKSLTIVENFDEDKKYGKISFKIIPNFDFYLEVLKLGPDVAIEEPSFVREQMKAIVKKMMERYGG